MSRFEKKFGKFKRGIKSVFSTRKRAFSSMFVAVMVFILMNLAARPVTSQQLLVADISYLPDTVLGSFMPTSFTEKTFTLVYALLSGPAIVLMYLQFTSFGSSAKDAASILPGIVASGCVGCGAGFVGLLGLTGAFAVLPFNGQLITVAAIILLIYFITKTGNPETCSLK